jgi:transcriptional regulator of met regulon
VNGGGGGGRRQQQPMATEASSRRSQLFRNTRHQTPNNRECVVFLCPFRGFGQKKNETRRKNRNFVYSFCLFRSFPVSRPFVPSKPRELRKEARNDTIEQAKDVLQETEAGGDRRAYGRRMRGDGAEPDILNYIIIFKLFNKKLINYN